ncbi:energy-coupling factor transporter transmembrane component T [Desulfovirgula thermocuniculi]|uniref:energy-coupling factor transporter transmembrane component T n=1 Tax=Desulfovirgula thermocuniculi TaxID=348842 RepID=UPI00042018BD|nr:energy-coupling factor transporter transmembrane component T [Desulfovirgula thermocuniculi]
MWEKLFYREKGLFLQSLHPAAMLAYLLVFLLLCLLYENPLYLLALFFLLALLNLEAEGREAWEGFLKGGLLLVVLIMVVNSLVIRAGSTVIWSGPAVPLWGKLQVSLEALYYGATSGLRFLVLLSLFCLYNLVVSPDKLLSLLAGFAYYSVLAVVLATRFFPVVVRNLLRIKEVQELRGVDFNQGTLWERVQKYSSLYGVLLLSSLEDAMGIAESMQARAFGSGKRTLYRHHLWRPRDTICLAGSLGAFSLALWGWFHGYGRYEFYPEADVLIKDAATVGILLLVCLGLSLPLLLSKGWKRWPFLRSKI